MTRARRPIVANRDAAKYGGFAALALGFLLVWDAYEGRGFETPKLVRWLTFW